MHIKFLEKKYFIVNFLKKHRKELKMLKIG